MFNLSPYRKQNTLQSFDPFGVFDSLDRNFFGGKDLGTFHTDITDNGKAFVLEADLPGVKKDDIKIDLNDGYMTISAERHSNYEEKDKAGNYVRCERSYGTFSRSFDTDGIDAAAISAKFDNGVLTLTMPKLTETVPTTRRLEIE